jgi:hypothetical protein
MIGGTQNSGVTVGALAGPGWAVATKGTQAVQCRLIRHGRPPSQTRRTRAVVVRAPDLGRCLCGSCLGLGLLRNGRVGRTPYRGGGRTIESPVGPPAAPEGPTHSLQGMSITPNPPTPPITALQSIAEQRPGERPFASLSNPILKPHRSSPPDASSYGAALLRAY